MKAQNSAQSIKTVLQEEKEWFNKILAQVEAQLAAIQGEDEKGLREIIETKGELLRKVEELRKQRDGLVSRIDLQNQKAVDRETRRIREEMETILEKIIEKENVCQKELHVRKLSIQGKLLDLQQGKTLLKGYASNKRVKPKISKNV